MSEETKQENPQQSGEIVAKEERNAKGEFVKGHTKVGGVVEGSVFSLTSILKQELQTIPEDKKVSRAISIIRKIAAQAESGDATSQKLIMNYIEGMPRQNIGLDGGKDGQPLSIKWEE